MVLAVRNRRAFTLVEILVVFGVVGVLIAVLLPALNGARARARQASCLANLKQLYLAEIAYATDHSGVLAYNGTWVDTPDFSEKGHLYSQIWGRALESYLGVGGNSTVLTDVDSEPDAARRNSALYCSGTPWEARREGPFFGSSYPRVLNQWVYDSAKPGRGNRIHRGAVGLSAVAGSSRAGGLKPSEVIFHFEGKGYWEIEGITGISAAYPVLPPDARGSWHDLDVNLLYWDGRAESAQPEAVPSDPIKTKAWGPPGLTRDDLLVKRGF